MVDKVRKLKFDIGNLVGLIDRTLNEIKTYVAEHFLYDNNEQFHTF